MTNRRLVIMLAVVAMMLGAMAPALAGGRDKSGMIDFATGEGVQGHMSIARASDSVDVAAHLRNLNAGHAFTIWAVVWNDPSNCVNGPVGCDESDLGVDDNVVIWSGIGGVANGGGNLNGRATLPAEGGEGPIPGGVTDAEGAEIHFVVQDHGPASDDSATLLAQTTTFEGGCGDGAPPTAPPDTCVDVQAAVFLP